LPRQAATPNDDKTSEQSVTPSTWRGRASKLISLGVSLAILIALGLSAKKVDLIGALRQINLAHLALAVALMPVAMAVRGFRLDGILAKSGKRLGLARAMTITFIGTSLNVLLPSNMGDVVKAYYAYRYNLAKEVVLSVVIIDKVFAMIAAMLVGMVAAASQNLWPAAGLAGLISLGLITVVFVPQLIPWRLLSWVLSKTLGRTLGHERAIEASRLPLRLKLTSVLLSLLACALAYSQYYLICRALGLSVPIALVWVAAPLMDLAKAVPMTANGLGTREAVAVYMLGRTGVPSGDALLSSLIFTAVSLWAPALVGAPFVWLATRTGRDQATVSRRA
jgi:glycosyltransferase 2 family protein